MNALLLVLIFCATAFIQIFIGGMRPVFAIPGYILVGLAGVASIFLLRKSRPLPSVICLASTVIFCSYIVGRAYLSPVEYLSRPDRYMVLACLIVYLIFALYLTDAKLRLYFIFGLFLLAVGHMAIGFIQFSHGENYLPFGYLRHDYGQRASGFYVCPNHYAGLIEMLAVIAAAIGVWSRVGVKTRMLVLYFVPMAIAGIAISGSRGGYLSTAVAFAFFSFLSLIVVRQVMPKHLLLLGSATVLILLAVGFGGVTMMKRNDLLASRVKSTFEKNNMRLQLWDAAIKQYHSQPVTGTGAGTYLYLGRLYRDPRVESDPVWVHNDYYHLLAEYGWVGAVLCALFVGSHLWYGLAACRAIVRKRLLDRNVTTSNALAVNLGSLAAIAAILAHSVVDFNAHIVGNSLVLALLFGVLANPPMPRIRRGEAGELPVLPFRLLVPLCALVILADAAPHLPGEWYAEKARVALRDKKYLTAIREAKRGLEVEKTNPDLHFYLGEARRLLVNQMPNEIARKSMSEAALGAFRDSIKLFPQDEKVWVRMSQALDLMGLHDEALGYLDKAQALDPNLRALNTYYGAHYEIAGDNQTALRYYEKAAGHELARKSREDVLRRIQGDAGR